MNNFNQEDDNYFGDNIERYDQLKRDFYPDSIENEKDNNNEEQNFSFGNKLHNSINTLLTNTSIAIDKENENFEISFFSKNKNEDNNIIKNKKLTKESIEILKNYISKEIMIISKKNINENENAICSNKSIKNIKKHLFTIDDKINLYFQNPYMRKNLKKIKEVNTNTKVYKEEKIKYNEGNIKMKNIKDCQNCCE